MMQKFVWAACGTIAAALSVFVLWMTNVPLGIPEEWTWNRLPRDEISLGNLQLAGICAAVYVGFVLIGGQRLKFHYVRRLELLGWLTGLMLVSAFWLWQSQDTAPTAGQWAKAPFVLYYPSSSGYFYKVRYDHVPVKTFLAQYEQLMSERDVLHVGTHPPGLFLVFYGLIGLTESNPGLASLITPTMPGTFRDAFAIVKENTSVTTHPAVAIDEVTLWLATVLVLGCAVATILPLFGLLRATLPRDHAWYGAALWPLVPAIAIFQPKSDAAYPFIATLFVWLCWNSWRRHSAGLAVLAGLVLWCGLMCSLAFLPVVLFLGLLIGTDFWRHPPKLSKTLIWVAWNLAGFVIPCALLWGLTGLPMHRVWWWNYQNHAGFYAEYHRTWWKWLLVNPVELSFAVGLPLMVLAGNGLWQIPWSKASGPLMTRWATLLGIAVWSLLWVTGKNSGEAARLWLLLMPGVVWLAAHGLAGQTKSPTPGQRSDTWHWVAFWLLLQAGTAACTIHRIGGFHLIAPG